MSDNPVDHTADEAAPPVAPVAAPEPPAPEPAAAPEPPAPEVPPPDVPMALDAIIAVMEWQFRLMAQAVGAIPAISGMGNAIKEIERELERARKAMSPPAG